MSKFGFSDEEWSAAKREATSIMVDRARRRGLVAYSQLAEVLKEISLEAHDPRLFGLLDEISTEEDGAGRGLLSVVVVHKDGDQRPGPGFFQLAKQRGRDTSDVVACWISELQKVYTYWSKQTPAGLR